MQNFWDSEVWGGLNLAAVLLLSLLAANALKRKVRFLRASLIPTSVLGGLILLATAGVYRAAAKQPLFDTAFFGGNGTNRMEALTYHMLALGFIASAFRTGKSPSDKDRRTDILNTGVTTVAIYLMQGFFGLGITLILAMFVKDLFPAAGALLPFGYGQGTGQALNYGSIYEAEYGFTGGRSFGLSIAALGFLSASLGGVIWLNVLKRKGKYVWQDEKAEALRGEDVQAPEEIPMNGGLEKLTIQAGLVAGTYFLAYLIMRGLGRLVPGFRSVIFGFNFLFGVIAAVIVKAVMGALRKKGIVRREYRSSFLMTRISNFCFDLMIVAGVAAIRLEMVTGYWWILLLLGAVGLIITFAYSRLVAVNVFPSYAEEQFMVCYGMYTGTASTGIMLLRELDPDFATPAADNLVYQNLPAMVIGFPIMILATMAPTQPWLVMGIMAVFFAALNVVLFRKKIFKKK